MKKKVLAGLLSFALAFSMLPGIPYADGGSQVVYAEEAVTRPENRVWDLASDTTAVRPTLEGNTGEFDGIQIDTTVGKFSPRASDTQVNAGTVMTVPVEANSNGAVLTFRLSGNSASLAVGETQYDSAFGAVTIEIEPSDTATECTVSFVTQAYLASIELTYSEPEEEYPGVPENVEAADATYSFESAEGFLGEDGTTPANDTLEGVRGTFHDMKIDASATGAKFALQTANARVQVNAGTVLYIPAAYDEAGAELLISGTKDGSNASAIKVNDVDAMSNDRLALDMSDASVYPQYIKVEFVDQCYVTGISLNYVSDSDYPDPEVTAKDKVWNFAADGDVTRPDLQGNQGEYDGIQIDARTGKFSPRDGDVQLNAVTTLYIPVAPDAEGASITVAANNYNNLTVTLDGEKLTIGEETALPSVDANTYVPLTFGAEGETGSCYLYNITVDYFSDNEVNVNTVTVGVGEGYDYEKIQDALEANESSSSAPLVLKIAPGTYSEKVTVDKPWVSFQPLEADGGDIIIEASYYSSNTFDAEGNFIPQDEFDLGTDQSGTVLLTANATGFSAEGITFQNSYNVEDHTAEGEQTPAVALGSAADRVYFKNCKFIGRQDTLYLHGTGARVNVEDSYIEGTVDFIFGDADAYFVNCELHMAAYEGRNTGYFTAANTKKGDTGLVFDQCKLTVDESYGEGSRVSLGRPWQTECYTESTRTEDGTVVTVWEPDRKNPTYENTASSVTFIECTMDSAIQDTRWNAWTRKHENGETVDVTYHPDVHFAEYNSKDESGAYLDLADYPDIVLGTMERVGNAQEVTDGLLSDMGFGTGIGNWTPSLPEEPVIENPFIDLGDDMYYYEPVMWAYENKIITGTDSIHFEPEAACTRAQAVLILWRYMGSPEPETTEHPFEDLGDDMYYYKAVLWAYENGITNGKDSTHFAADEEVTRGQFATMLYRAEGSPEPAGENPFEDVPSDQYYAEAVVWAYESGITTGIDDTHFAPDQKCTRGQAATLMYRAQQ